MEWSCKDDVWEQTSGRDGAKSKLEGPFQVVVWPSCGYKRCDEISCGSVDRRLLGS
jgi:hypothetical protein